MSGDESGSGPPGRDDADRLDEDAAWAAIVAGYGDRVLGDPEDDASSDTADPEAGDDTGASSDADAGRLTVFDAPSYDARSAWRRDAGSAGSAPAEHEESSDRYVPPEPPPLPRPRGVRGFAWLGVAGVPVMFLVLTLLDVTLVSGLGLLLFLWFIAGFGYLIGTMTDDHGDGWDDGARV